MSKPNEMRTGFEKYLGDSVYAKYDSFGTITICTNNGYLDDPRNIIHIDKDVLLSLLKFINEIFDLRELFEKNKHEIPEWIK